MSTRKQYSVTFVAECMITVIVHGNNQKDAQEKGERQARKDLEAIEAAHYRPVSFGDLELYISPESLKRGGSA